MGRNAENVPSASKRKLLTKEDEQQIGNTMNDARVSFFTDLLPDAAFRRLMLQFLEEYAPKSTQWRALFDEDSERKATEIATALQVKMSASLTSEENIHDWKEEIEQKIFSITLMKRLRRFVEQQIEVVSRVNNEAVARELTSILQSMDDVGYSVYREGEIQFISCNQGLVGMVAGSFCSTSRELGYDDLFAAGQLGLIRAIEKWDPALDLKFSTYAVDWITQAIRRTIRTEDHTVVPSDQVYQTRITISGLLNGAQRSLTPQEIQQLHGRGISNDTIALALELQHTCSLHTPLGADDTGSIGDFLIADNEPVSEIAEMNEQQRMTQGCMAFLLPEHGFILTRLYGLGFHLTLDDNPSFVRDNTFYNTPLTLETIGKLLGKSRERVNQIRQNAADEFHFAQKNTLHAQWNTMEDPQLQDSNLPLSLISGMDSDSLSTFYAHNIFTIADLLEHQSHYHWQELLKKGTKSRVYCGIAHHCTSAQLTLGLQSKPVAPTLSYQDRMLRCASLLTVVNQTSTTISFALRETVKRPILQRNIHHVMAFCERKQRAGKGHSCNNLWRSIGIYNSLLQYGSIEIEQCNREHDDE